jgi:hypothetical protein
VELDTGLQFASSASIARHEDRKARNRKNARKAYDALLRFIPKGSLTREESDEIARRLACLKSTLLNLGENI